jgi:uncharacterized protein YbcI
VPIDPGFTPADRLAGGQLSTAISNALVRIHREYLGRGPNRVRTFLKENTLVLIMEEVLTKAEHSLVADGRSDEVLRTRSSFQQVMKADIVGAVEELTGRKVIAFMSTNHIDPDLGCEVLLFEPDTADTGPLEQSDIDSHG